MCVKILINNKELAMSKFKVGDSVILNSGGPQMVVASVLSNGYLLCEWIDANGKVNRHEFKPLTVRIGG